MGTLSTDIFGGVERCRSIDSKRKGSDNEREVAKLFTKWVGAKFVRVPSSGGLSVQWQGNRFLTGDVVPVDEKLNFAFSIEAKFYKELNLKQNLGKRNKVYGFWGQARRDAELAGKYPLLIVRQNKMPKGEFILFVDTDMKRLGILHTSAGEDPETGDIIWGYNTTTLFEKVEYREFLRVYLELIGGQ